MDAARSIANLEKVYDVDSFRNWGHQLIDLLADHVQEVKQDREYPVIPYRNPETELAFWEKDFIQGTSDNPMNFFQDLLDHSIYIHHPRYMGHQVSVPALVAGLSGLMTDVLSNGTGVYEMGMASNALEKVITDWMAKKIGYSEEGSGFLTSGGSLANLTALLAARKNKASTDVWKEGHSSKLAVLVSSEAHYCIDRAARIMGLGDKGIVKVPVDESFKMNTNLLEERLKLAQLKGLEVFALVGSASSTATGSYDDLEAQADFCEKHNLWFHVDGAHGGSVVFSDTYRHLAKGIERADSITIDFHKMLMTPSLTTALMFKQAEASYQTFQQQAQFLWESQQAQEWFNSGKRTFECTKLMMATKVYSILKTYGEGIFGENVDRLYGLASQFAHIVQEASDFELAIEPQSNIVNFRYINAPESQLNGLNQVIREALVASGKFYIVQTTIHEKRYLRTTIMNPLTTEDDFMALLNEIRRMKV